MKDLDLKCCELEEALRLSDIRKDQLEKEIERLNKIIREGDKG